jgi:hypothetical protein
VSWSLRFAEPVTLPDGAKLATLREAVAHLGKAIPKSDHNMPSATPAAERNYAKRKKTKAADASLSSAIGAFAAGFLKA